MKRLGSLILDLYSLSHHVKLLWNPTNHQLHHLKIIVQKKEKRKFAVQCTLYVLCLCTNLHQCSSVLHTCSTVAWCTDDFYRLDAQNHPNWISRLFRLFSKMLAWSFTRSVPLLVGYKLGVWKYLHFFVDFKFEK